MGRTLLAVAATGFVATIGAQQRPLPDERALFERTRANLERSQTRQSAYAYHERRRELHTNPFGKLGSGEGTEEYEVIPQADGSVTRQLIARDGVPVPGAAVERSRPRTRIPMRRSAIADTADALDFTLDHRETRNGRDVLVVTFAPHPDAHPQTREGRVAQNFRGRIYIDEVESEVIRVEGTAVDDITYGLGVVARVDKGATATLVRERVDDDTWLPTSIRLSGEGRAILFRKLRIDHFIEWFDYRRVRP